MSRASKDIYAESVNVSAKRPRQKRKSGRKDDEAFNPNMDEDGNIRRNAEEKKVVCYGSDHERKKKKKKREREREYETNILWCLVYSEGRQRLPYHQRSLPRSLSHSTIFF